MEPVLGMHSIHMWSFRVSEVSQVSVILTVPMGRSGLESRASVSKDSIRCDRFGRRCYFLFCFLNV